MLMGITFIAFILIYQLLPGFYQNHKLQTVTEQVENKLLALEQLSEPEAERQLVKDLFKETNIAFKLVDDQGEEVLPESYEEIMEEDTAEPDFDIQFEISVETSEGNHLTIISGPASPKTSEPIQTTIIESPTFATNPPINFAYAYLTKEFFYENANRDQRFLQVSIPLYPLAEAQQVIMSIYPYAAVVSILFALIFAFLFSRWTSTPIKKIQVATAKMSRLEPNVAISVKTRDEIGTLSHDISHLYEQLRSSIVTLEQEVSRYESNENRKIEFLQSVSHEMKTPLASANALIEGILYEVSPFHENQRHYLEECRDFLQKTIQLTKESLLVSEKYKEPVQNIQLSQLVQEVSKLYGVIFMSKQFSYQEAIPADITIRTKVNLLSKVLSNLYSNAANYTVSNGKIKTWYEDGWLNISNTCEPLEKIRIEEIFKPLMTQNTNEHATGLGLFIVKQLLKQLELAYVFEPLPDKSGMVFRLRLNLE